MTVRNMPLGFSMRLVLLLLILHAAAIVAVYAAAMPVLAKAGISAAVLSSLFFHLARDGLRRLPSAWVAIALDADRVLVTHRDSSRFAGQVNSKTVVCPFFVVLRIVPEGGRMEVSRIIFPDALVRGAFRELCVYLKFV